MLYIDIAAISAGVDGVINDDVVSEATPGQFIYGTSGPTSTGLRTG